MEQTTISEKVFQFQQPLPQKHKFPKSGYWNGRIRFNIIMNILVTAFAVIPFFIPTIYSIGIGYFFVAQWIIFFILYCISTYHLKKHHSQNSLISNFLQPKININIEGQKNELQVPDILQLECLRTNRFYKYKHILMTFIYKEPLELLEGTIENLKKIISSKEAILLVGFEEKSPERLQKIQAIKDKYQNSFEQLIFSIHPFGQEGEIPGKCSNSNYAQRVLVSHLTNTKKDFNPDEYIMTNFDTDTRFQSDYLIKLEGQIAKYCKTPDERSKVVWQPILFYNWNLNQRTFFVRITSLIRNMFMMGVLIPLQLNVMSIYSFSLKLCIDGHYTHPAYQMDDIILYIRWFIKSKTQIKIRPVYSATLSGPTSGKNLFEEISEWARQIRRWTIGSGEVFHYYVAKSKHIQPNFKYSLWGLLYLNYYALFLIAQSFFMISCAIQFNFIAEFISIEEQYLQIGLISAQYLIIILMFFVNGSSQWMLDSIREKEKFNFIITVIHILFSPLTLISYAITAFYGLCEVMVRGKQVCKHGTSKKENI